MIESFGDRATEDLYHGRRTPQTASLPPALITVALRKLDMLNAAGTLVDLRSPPGNRLELVRGNLAGSYSIRVNEQWRLVFRWEDGNAHDARIEDYHR